MRLQEVQRNYDRASSWYDRWSDLVFGVLLGLDRERERTVEMLGPIRGGTIVDVGCGTGKNFPLLASRVGPSGRIVALDYSEGMLDQARKRIERVGWSNVELIRGDAVTLSGVPEMVDGVISVWCLGIVYDLTRALDRAIDVLRPGGRLAVMDFGRSVPPRGPLHWLAPVYHCILERAGIDSAHDLDDRVLQQRWEEGRHLVRRRLIDVREETYLQEGGLIIAGLKPETGL